MKKKTVTVVVYKAIDVARYIIYYLEKSDRFTTTLKLQKYLYFIQAFFMVKKGRPCFKEKIYATDGGAFIDEVWEEFKCFGGGTALIGNFKFPIEEEDKKLIEIVVDEFYSYSVSGLTDLQMNQLPWRNAYHRGEITPQALYDYFKEE